MTEAWLGIRCIFLSVLERESLAFFSLCVTWTKNESVWKYYRILFPCVMCCICSSSSRYVGFCRRITAMAEEQRCSLHFSLCSTALFSGNLPRARIWNNCLSTSQVTLVFILLSFTQLELLPLLLQLQIVIITIITSCQKRLHTKRRLVLLLLLLLSEFLPFLQKIYTRFCCICCFPVSPAFPDGQRWTHCYVLCTHPKFSYKFSLEWTHRGKG